MPDETQGWHPPKDPTHYGLGEWNKEYIQTVRQRKVRQDDYQ